MGLNVTKTHMENKENVNLSYVLDIGQKLVVKCYICNIVYNKLSKIDVKFHDKIHKKNIQRLGLRD